MLQASQGVPGAKDGKGIGDVADGDTINRWARDYLTGHYGDSNAGQLTVAFRFGVRAEGRFAGQSFIEAEAELRSEWSSQKEQLPWDTVRDSVWAGFDRARDRRV
jgi:hypothetical protein